MRIEDVLVPIDFSPGSLRALEFAADLVGPGGQVLLLHVIDANFVARLAAEGFADPEAATARMQQAAEQRLRELVAERGGRPALDTMVVVGTPFVEILRIAVDLDVQVIVISIHGHREGSLEELLFGSTAEKVLRGAVVPVVCVPRREPRGGAV